MLVTPTFLAGAVSITVFFPTFARNKKTSSTARTRARGSCELKDRTVINNRFLPAPVCAAPGKASTQGEIFFVEALQEVDGGENVGHKNVPVRNGPGEGKQVRVEPEPTRRAPVNGENGHPRRGGKGIGAAVGEDPVVNLVCTQIQIKSRLPRYRQVHRSIERRDGKSSTESFIDHSTINRTSWRLFLGGTAIRYVSTLGEADLKHYWPLVIDHRVTVPLPNFKYAHTSQLVTTNYLGRLLALEEAI
ncbi:hypothetical protein ALC60_11461 [Trachymyrmex zeteki]|uniref:Uncharacterized protein n=1 Tax=Mycetomoellerius zeteki TaxID=64791 RepID=A0A151WNB6_9HYME|nr:hypothetical protein ALC60_11461 [Trachymyrmex zeteki]